MQAIGFQALADADGLVHMPALVDVAHELRRGTDNLADAPDALDLDVRGGVTGQCKLRLHGGPAALNQPAGGGRDLLEGQRAHQRTAGIGRNAIAKTAQQLCHRQSQRLAANVPQRRINGRQRQGEDAGGTAAAGCQPQLVNDAFNLLGILANHQRAQVFNGAL